MCRSGWSYASRGLRRRADRFLVSAAEHPDRVRQHRTAVDAAAAAGVERIVSFGLRHTFLRESRYLDFGRVAPVARDDFADVAVEVIVGDGHHGRTYDVTGARLQTMAELAVEPSWIMGRDIADVNETLEQAWEWRRSDGAPDWEVEGWVTSYLAVAAGELAVPSDTVRRLTGHEPLDLRGLVERDPSLVEGMLRA